MQHDQQTKKMDISKRSGKIAMFGVGPSLRFLILSRRFNPISFLDRPLKNSRLFGLRQALK
jgi:hypothetical protein